MCPIKHYHEGSVGSTQDRARALLDGGEGAPFLITADEQTNGRGRLGRQWVSPPGNFFGSLVVQTAVPSARYGEYSFLAAVVLRDAITAFSETNITFKWPNDLLASGKKCAGILIEVAGNQLIIGMGVNLLHTPPPDAVCYPTTALNISDHASFTHILSEKFSTRHASYLHNGFDIIRTEWLQHAHALGQAIIVQTPQQQHTGIFAGIDMDGSLRLTQGQQIIKVTAADVLLS